MSAALSRSLYLFLEMHWKTQRIPLIESHQILFQTPSVVSQHIECRQTHQVHHQRGF